MVWESGEFELGLIGSVKTKADQGELRDVCTGQS